MPTSSTPSSLLGDKPFLRLYHSSSLRIKTLAVIMAIEQAPDPTRYRDTLSDLVMELTDSGLEYYFLRALDYAKVSFVVKQSATVGMGAVMRVVGPLVHNVIGHMDKDQLLAVCSHVRQLME